jgi:cytochrome c peroxidase
VLVRLAWSPNVEYVGGALMRQTPSFHEVASTALPAPADGVALDLEHDRAIVSTLLGGGVAIVGRAAPAAPRIVRFDPPRDDEVSASRGARLFVRAGDPRIAEDGRACATCHVDGLSDGLVWNTPRGPRRTPILAGRVDRDGPFGWNGESRDLSSHLATTIHKNLAGKGLAPGELADLTAYLRSLPAPRRGASARGEELFASAGCAGCHVRGGTDGERHDVGSGGAFVTPSLVGLGRTRAFFHDGRYKSLEALLAKTGGKMGAAMPAADRDALADYLTSL